LNVDPHKLNGFPLSNLQLQFNYDIFWMDWLSYCDQVSNGKTDQKLFAKNHFYLNFYVLLRSFGHVLILNFTV